MRLALTLSLALVLPAGLLAADKGGGKGGGNKGGGKSNNTAEIKALEQQKKQLQSQEKTHLRQIETQTRAHMEALHKERGSMETALKEKLELEKATTVKRIEQRYEYILKHDFPLKVWGELDQAAKTLHAVHENLKTANIDYGGNKAAAIRSLGVAVADLQNRVTIHHWPRGEREGTVKHLAAAEGDLQNALAYSANKWGVGTPKGMPKSQLASNEQLASALITIDNTRGLVQYAQWEEGVDHKWGEGVRRQRAEEIHKTKAAFDARIKSVDKEVGHHIEQAKKQLEAKKKQSIAQTKAHYAAAIKQIDAQIKHLKSSQGKKR